MRLKFLKKFLFNPTLQLALLIKSLIPQKINFLILKKNTLNMFINPSNLNFILFFLKNNSLISVKILSDIIVVDFPKKTRRFKIIYNLLDNKKNLRLNLITFLEENKMICSIKKIYPSAGWLEREAWDMFGIFFFNNGDLRRILTDYGFKGFPLRKDFPLTGYIELRHDDSLGDIVYEPVELTQELRFFNFSTGWEKDQ